MAVNAGDGRFASRPVGPGTGNGAAAGAVENPASVLWHTFRAKRFGKNAVIALLLRLAVKVNATPIAAADKMAKAGTTFRRVSCQC
jgi:hypothetical protein